MLCQLPLRTRLQNLIMQICPDITLVDRFTAPAEIGAIAVNILGQRFYIAPHSSKCVTRNPVFSKSDLNPADLPYEYRLAALEIIIRPYLETFDKMVGPVEITGYISPAQLEKKSTLAPLCAVVPLHMTTEDGVENFEELISLYPDSGCDLNLIIERLKEADNPFKVTTAAELASFPAHIIIDSLDLSIGELNSLCVGDALVLGTFINNDRFKISCAGQSALAVLNTVCTPQLLSEAKRQFEARMAAQQAAAAAAAEAAAQARAAAEAAAAAAAAQASAQSAAQGAPADGTKAQDPAAQPPQAESSTADAPSDSAAPGAEAAPAATAPEAPGTAAAPATTPAAPGTDAAAPAAATAANTAAGSAPAVPAAAQAAAGTAATAAITEYTAAVAGITNVYDALIAAGKAAYDSQGQQVSDYFLVILEPFTTDVITFSENSFMAFENVDDLPVRVDCVLSSLNLTVADLRQISRGARLPLNNDSLSNISIFVNGRIIGTGKVIEIDGTYAVQIKELMHVPRVCVEDSFIKAPEDEATEEEDMAEESASAEGENKREGEGESYSDGKGVGEAEQTTVDAPAENAESSESSEEQQPAPDESESADK